MQRPLWFKAKRYGYGWYPSTWQGWLVIAVYVAFITWDFYRLDAGSHSASDTIRPWFLDLLVATVLLLAITVYTGEKARWQWGGKD